MPLVRYEIRSEYELANRELYRSAPKNDPEAILEGVAMVSLVGIVRQLGDLAEFAADIFHELHESLMATASRSHELSARVSQLEGELPALEKPMLSRKSNPLQFAYSPGVDWHASIRSDQNHCTQGDLPRFIRSSYEECRGPPRLFLLDKFDVGGVGACLKRYTDPSFFKMEWASSELMKAEKVQQDKKSRRNKTRRRKEEVKEPTRPPVQQVQPRMRYSTISTSSLDGLSDSTAPLNAITIESDQSGSKPFPFVTFLGGSQRSSSREGATKPVENLEEARTLESGISAAAAPVEPVSQPPEEKVLIESAVDKAVEDATSEPEQYLDAMTTMDSESDLESRRLSNVRTEAAGAEPGEERSVARQRGNEAEAFFEDARNSTTETESKYSSELTPIPVEAGQDESQLEQHENVETKHVTELVSLETDTPAAGTRLDSDDEDDGEEKDVEPGVRASYETGEPHQELVEARFHRELAESSERMIDFVPDIIHEEDNKAAVDEEDVIPESKEISSEAESEEEPLLRKRPSFGADDDETFDVEVIQVHAEDDRELAREVEFEPLAASDEDSVPELEVERDAVEFRQHSPENALDDQKDVGVFLPHSLELALDDQQEVHSPEHDVVDDEPRGGEHLPDDILLENGVELSRNSGDELLEPLLGDKLDDEEARRHQLSPAVPLVVDDQSDSSAVPEDEARALNDDGEGPGTPEILIEEVKTPEESRSPEPEASGLFIGRAAGGSPVSMNGDEDFESASSHEDFFMARSSSRFSDLSDEQGFGVEVDDDKEGYFGDDDSTRNHSEGSEPGRSSRVPDEKQEETKSEQILFVEPVLDSVPSEGHVAERSTRDLEHHSTGVPALEEHFTQPLVQDVDEQLVDESSLEFEEEEKKLAVDHLQPTGYNEEPDGKKLAVDHQLSGDEEELDYEPAGDEEELEEKKLAVDQHRTGDNEEFEEKKLAVDHQPTGDNEEFEEKKLAVDHQTAAEEAEEEKLVDDEHLPELIWTGSFQRSVDDQQEAKQVSEAPASGTFAPTLILEDPQATKEAPEVAATGASAHTLVLEDELELESSSGMSSLSSSPPHSPIFSALHAPLSPPIQPLSGFSGMVAPSSPPSSLSYSFEGMPPLPPLPPLRWRTLASPAFLRGGVSETSPGFSARRSQLEHMPEPEHLPETEELKTVVREASAEPGRSLHAPDSLMVAGHTQTESEAGVRQQEASDELKLPVVGDAGAGQERAPEVSGNGKVSPRREFRRDEALYWRDNLVFEAEEPGSSFSQQQEVSVVDGDLAEEVLPRVTDHTAAQQEVSPIHLERSGMGVEVGDLVDAATKLSQHAEEDRLHEQDAASLSPEADHIPEVQQTELPLENTVDDKHSQLQAEQMFEEQEKPVSTLTRGDPVSESTPGDRMLLEEKLVQEPEILEADKSYTEAELDTRAGDESPALEQHGEKAEQEHENEKSQTLPVSTMSADVSSPSKQERLEQNDEEKVTEPRTPDTRISTPKDPADEALIQAISAHDRSKLKKVPSDTPTPKSGERDVLLEQIRSQSFNLRHTVVEKKEMKETTPRLVTNINVAAILEKANAIRQAFAGSEDDEEDDWSDG